jgi:hypothetical protein
VKMKAKNILRPGNKSARSYNEVMAVWSSSYVAIPLRYGSLGMDSHFSLVL